MLNFKQEKTVESLLQELKNLQIKTRIIESAKTKGLSQTDEQEDLQVAMESVRSAAIEIAKRLAQMFESKGFEFFAQKLENQSNRTEDLEKDLKDLEQLLTEIQKEAEKRYQRNVQRRKRIEAAEKQAEESNEKERLKQTMLTSKVEKSQNDATIQPTAFANKNSSLPNPKVRKVRYSAFPSRLITVPSQQKPRKHKSNLIRVKSSEAKAKDFANQRALKRHDLEMSKDVPTFGPSQMTR